MGTLTYINITTIFSVHIHAYMYANVFLSNRNVQTPSAEASISRSISII